MNIAVITGASSGMGREFAVQLDALHKYDELWIIARRKEKLDELKGIVHATVRSIPLDLTKEESYEEFKKLLKENAPKIRTLVNASGFGKFGKFTEIPLSEQCNMVDLNIKALMTMTYICLPYMPLNSEIYELCSLSSFQPVPYINVYAATKAFVLSFSRALNVELQDRNIHVIAVSPGWVDTEFIGNAEKDDTINYYNKLFKADEVVSQAILDSAKGKDVSVCGAFTKAQARAVKLLPHKLVMKAWCKQQKL
ncbi:MAG: SDR family NAD(P)-dependent oxidoreductase [Candidatus Metalachnospira sp.]|nr:SDR family NAD(P)-dependent oxidoreductase [Candidatus Metalachnospira sp.]